MILLKQGIFGNTRIVFWCYLFEILKKNPGGIGSYLTLLAQLEHFLDYRKAIKNEILLQLSDYETHTWKMLNAD